MLNATAHPHAGSTPSGQRRRADRDLAQQVAHLRLIIEQHSNELEPLLYGTSQCSTDAMKAGEFRLYDDAQLNSCLETANQGAERLLIAELRKAKSLGSMRTLAKAPSEAAMKSLERDFPHFAPVLGLVRERAVLASLAAGRVFSLPPILLAGSPGVGKTAFSEAVAEALGVPTRRMDMATATASFVLAGSHSSWASARPGVVWSLLQSPVGAGLMLLDELDKAAAGNYPPTGPLYRLLESSSAKVFTDEYTELPVDASHLMWMATCNDVDAIEPALLSRFVVFEIPRPTAEQMIPIAQSVYRKCRRGSSWGAMFPPELPADVAQALTVSTPRELVRLIESAVARAAQSRRLELIPADIRQAREVAHRHRPAPAKMGFM